LIWPSNYYLARSTNHEALHNALFSSLFSWKGSIYLSQNLFSKNLSPCSFPNVWDQVANPHKITGKCFIYLCGMHATTLQNTIVGVKVEILRAASNNSFRFRTLCLFFVFLALQPTVVVFSQPGSGL
jgi:hypothetical protein